VAQHTDKSDDQTPVADRIRQRLLAARKRYHANDSIADFIEPGELDLLQGEVADKLQDVLDALVIDTKSDHNTQDTARRVAKMLISEVFRGRYAPMPPVTEFPNIDQLNELMIVGPVTVRSACSHHPCPIIGQLWVGVMPKRSTCNLALPLLSGSPITGSRWWFWGRPSGRGFAVRDPEWPRRGPIHHEQHRRTGVFPRAFHGHRLVDLR